MSVQRGASWPCAKVDPINTVSGMASEVPKEPESRVYKCARVTVTLNGSTQPSNLTGVLVSSAIQWLAQFPRGRMSERKHT